jgi:hypothetical protein
MTIHVLLALALSNSSPQAVDTSEKEYFIVGTPTWIQGEGPVLVHRVGVAAAGPFQLRTVRSTVPLASGQVHRVKAKYIAAKPAMADGASQFLQVEAVLSSSPGGPAVVIAPGVGVQGVPAVQVWRSVKPVPGVLEGAREEVPTAMGPFTVSRHAVQFAPSEVGPVKLLGSDKELAQKATYAEALAFFQDCKPGATEHQVHASPNGGPAAPANLTATCRDVLLVNEKGSPRITVKVTAPAPLTIIPMFAIGSVSAASVGANSITIQSVEVLPDGVAVVNLKNAPQGIEIEGKGVLASTATLKEAATYFDGCKETSARGPAAGFDCANGINLRQATGSTSVQISVRLKP